MGLIEGVFGEIRHVVKDLVGRLFVDAVGRTALYSLFLVAVNEILPLPGHNVRLFLGHGTAHQVAPSQGIPGQVPDDLHDLLLVHDTAVGGL